MAIDGKYGRVQTERGKIGEDEPVVVFRAQDKLVPAMLLVYRDMCDAAGSPAHHLELIDKTRINIERWQQDHHVQIPRSDSLAPDA